MSMPIITSSNIKRCDAITDIIESVALQQTGLSHILNAEGEKIQAVLAISTNADELLAVNNSVESMVNSITRLEVILQGKLELFKNCICTECEEKTTVVTLTLGDDQVGNLASLTDSEYIYIQGDTGNTINFTTDSTESINVIGTLPDGFKFEDNILYINGDLTEDYELNFQIGDSSNNYTITIYVKYKI
ncbi:MAG: hypothetical protein R3Y13_04945 [bacterium]